MSYVSKLYNWYWDIHPFRPTMKERKQKDLMVKQIREMKQFKFRNKATDDKKKILIDSMKVLNAIKNKQKEKIIQNTN